MTKMENSTILLEQRISKKIIWGWCSSTMKICFQLTSIT